MTVPAQPCMLHLPIFTFVTVSPQNLERSHNHVSQFMNLTMCQRAYGHRYVPTAPVARAQTPKRGGSQVEAAHKLTAALMMIASYTHTENSQRHSQKASNATLEEKLRPAKPGFKTMTCTCTARPETQRQGTTCHSPRTGGHWWAHTARLSRGWRWPQAHDRSTIDRARVPDHGP